MNIVFMGTPEFSVPCLKRLVDLGHEISGVFSQPDKPKGRGYALTPPAVKVEALANNIPVFQPTSMRDGEALEILKKLSPELIVVVAFGKILPREILELPKYGCINIHASLLPKYRGAAPIQWSVINGEEKTGVTSMQMDVGLDTGDMLIAREIQITKDMTAGELHDKLSELGAKVLEETVRTLENGELAPVKQDSDKSCYAPILTKALCPINWNDTAADIHNKIRGLSPWPVATALLGGKTVKIHESRLLQGCGRPGEVIDSGKKLVVACGEGAVEIIRLQLEGKKAMAAEEFLRGNAVTEGSILQ